MTWAIIDTAASGGTWSTLDVGGVEYDVGVFTANADLVLLQDGDLDVRCVAKGGDGGENRGGGGGAGGFFRAIVSVTGGTLAIRCDDAESGIAFHAETEVFAGGDGGSMDAAAPQAANPGNPGGSGGGGSGGNATTNAPASDPSPGEGIPGQGFSGGQGRLSGAIARRSGGGGGGAGGAAPVPPLDVGGIGGKGVLDDIRGFSEWVCEGGPGNSTTMGADPPGGLEGPGCGGRGGNFGAPAQTTGKPGQVVIRAPRGSVMVPGPNFFRNWREESINPPEPALWVQSSGKYWDGAVWKPVMVLKHWDGTSWVQLPAPPVRRIT